MQQNQKDTNWEDIIFKEKNKDYGAYYIRKKYNKTLFISILSSICFVSVICLIIHLTFLKNQFQEYNELIDVHLDYFMLSDSMMNFYAKEKKVVPENKKEETKELKIVDSLYLDSLKADINKKIEDANSKKADSLLADSLDLIKKLMEIEQNKIDSMSLYITDLPQFSGGQIALGTYINTNIKYAEDESKKKLSGLVLVSFSIDKSGNTVNIAISKSANAYVDTLAFNIIKGMPKWIPSKNYNNKLKLIYTIPLLFSE